MPIRRRSTLIACAAASAALIAGCGGPPPPMARPAAFTALGVSAPYLSAEVIGGTRARAAKMAKARIGPLSPQAQPA